MLHGSDPRVWRVDHSRRHPPKGGPMLPPRRLPVAVATAAFWMLLALASGAQQAPPVPSKVLPQAQPPGASPRQAFVSPKTRLAYAFRVVPEGSDSDAGEKAEALSTDTSKA